MLDYLDTKNRRCPIATEAAAPTWMDRAIAVLVIAVIVAAALGYARSYWTSPAGLRFRPPGFPDAMPVRTAPSRR